MADKIQYSFRGVPFWTNNNSLPLGRRVQITELPFNQYALDDDFGHKARVFSFDAFVIGKDFAQKRDDLINALNAKGAGELNHPEFGRINCTVTGAEVSQSSNEIGMARFSLEFTEVRPLNQKAIIDTTSRIKTSSAALDGAILDTFKTGFDVNKKPSWVLDGAQNSFDKAFGYMNELSSNLAARGAPLNRFIRSGNDFMGKVRALATTPLNLALEVREYVKSLGALAKTPDEAFAALKLLMRFDLGIGGLFSQTPSRISEANNRTAIKSLVSVAAASEAVLLSAQLEFPSYDEAIYHRDSFAALLDDLALLAADAGDDEVWSALDACRLAVINDVNIRAGDLTRLSNISYSNSLPAVVIAHKLYGPENLDIDYEDVLARNKIKHPLLVVGGTNLEVLNAF